MGSGLDSSKLADTLEQMLHAEPPLPVLVGQVAGIDYAWIHLSLVYPTTHQEELPHGHWLLTFGYPSEEEPLTLLTAEHVNLPQDSVVGGWQPQIHATLLIPEPAAPIEVSRTILEIMSVIQRVDTPETVELALEY